MQEKIIVHITTSNPVQTQEGVYKLSRSRRNEASFKAKAKRTTTKNVELLAWAICKLCRHGQIIY